MKRRRSKRLEENNQKNKKRKTSNSSDSESESDSESDSDSDSELVIYVDSEEQLLEELKKTDRKTYDKFIEVKDVIDNSIPEISSIINEDISVNNKARIVELYEVFKLMEPMTEEWLLLKDRINMLICVYKEEYICLLYTSDAADEP